MNVPTFYGGTFDYDLKSERLVEVTRELESPDIWNDAERAQALGKERASLEMVVETINDLDSGCDDVEGLVELAVEESDEDTFNDAETEANELDKKLAKLEFRRMFSGDHDENGCYLDIQSGSGGTEAQDWAEMLMRMYLMWGEKNKYKVKTLDLQKAEPVGIKSVTIEIDGNFSFGHLKGENGVHRLVRISPFDSNAKRHTTFASVFVYPLADDSIEVIIDPSEISWDTFRASGAGGQGVNKTESAVRLKHEPSGITIENSESRSQLENKAKAIQLLKSQLYELEIRKKQEEKSKLEGSKKKIEWGSQIRSYVLHPYKMVKDLRTSYESSNPEKVLDGDLNAFIKAYLMEFGQK